MPGYLTMQMEAGEAMALAGLIGSQRVNITRNRDENRNAGREAIAEVYERQLRDLELVAATFKRATEAL